VGAEVTESQFTAKLLRALRSHTALREAWIVKHNDRTTSGIPDFSISVGRITLWFEVKIWGNELTKLQQWTIKQLGKGGVQIHARKDGKVANIIPIYPAALLEFSELVEEIVRRCVNS
jgi:hypothetical protein